MWHFLLIIIASIVHNYWIKGIPRGYAIRSGRHPSGSHAVGPAAADFPRDVCLTVSRNHAAVSPAAADFPRDVCLTVSRNHAVFLLYSVN